MDIRKNSLSLHRYSKLIPVAQNLDRKLFLLVTTKSISSRDVTRALIQDAYSYIHILPDRFLSNLS